jgi:hypothetical protein
VKASSAKANWIAIVMVAGFFIDGVIAGGRTGAIIVVISVVGALFAAALRSCLSPEGSTNPAIPSYRVRGVAAPERDKTGSAASASAGEWGWPPILPSYRMVRFHSRGPPPKLGAGGDDGGVAPGCKPGTETPRGFESLPAHQET